MNTREEQPVQTKAELIRASVIALVAAIILLVTVILPAEYGIDALGVGRLLGLDQLGAAPEVDPAGPVPIDGAASLDLPALVRSETAARTETVTVVVPGYEGIELKADMVAGQAIVFDWRTDGTPLYTDMHGEPPNAGDNEFTSYWKENRQSGGRGMLLARFDGTHGWYWQNVTEDPVTVTVMVSGFYQGIHEK